MVKVIVELDEEEIAELDQLLCNAVSVGYGTLAESEARRKLLKALEEATKDA